jgi:hypothetical protein
VMTDESPQQRLLGGLSRPFFDVENPMKATRWPLLLLRQKEPPQRHLSDRRSSRPLRSLLHRRSNEERDPAQSSRHPDFGWVGVELVPAARVAGVPREVTNLGGEPEAHGRKEPRSARGNASPGFGLPHGGRPRGRVCRVSHASEAMRRYETARGY